MKLTIIAGLSAFIIAIVATMYFTGTFGNIKAKINGNIEADDSKSELNSTQTEQEGEYNVESSDKEDQRSKPSIQKEIGSAKIELAKYKAQVAAEEAKLNAIKAEIESLNTTKSSINKCQQLAKLYSSMRPDEAALILCEIEADLTKEILSEMNDRTAGKIMGAIANVNPGYAARLSEIMADAGKIDYDF